MRRKIKSKEIMSESKVDELTNKLSEKDGREAKEEDKVEVSATDCTALFVGDSGSGKSTLIQSFLKPSSKDPKPTFALEYNYARRKGGGKDDSKEKGKNLSHIWELGGDILEQKLFEIPITQRTLNYCSIVVICDLSKPQDIIVSLNRWIALVRDVVQKRITELKVINPALVAQLKEQSSLPYTDSRDINRVKPCEIPLFIVANKYDALKSLSSVEKRLIWQVIRFIAHYNGATIVTTTSVDMAAKELFRGYCQSICFHSPLKPGLDINPDKPVYVTAGKDDYESILLGSSSGNSDAISQYVTNLGLARDCWVKFGELLKSSFGSPSPEPEVLPSDDGISSDRKNEFPEVEIDNMRLQRDSLLSRYLQDAERKELMLQKMNAVDNSASIALVDSVNEDRGESKGGASKRVSKTRK